MANFPYVNTVIAPTGGANAATGTGMTYAFTISLTSSNGELTITLTDTLTGFQTQLGAGNVTGIIPTYIYTFSNKVYVLAGSTAYFSAVEAPTVWNDPNGAGNGFITMSNYFSTNENLVAMAPYQGQALFVFRRLVQVWHTDPDPANYALVQTLPNIGTVAPESVQPVGDMDVYMLADTGVRSVRVRDASNNAIIADVGTPIDALLQPLLASLTDAQKATACGCVEPSSNRYWCYIPNPDGSPGLIWVFSYFPSSQVAAWGTYSPSYQVALLPPAANYTASTVTYTGLTVGARYAWLPGADEVSITNGTTTLKNEGAFTATATSAVVTGNAPTAAYTGALSQTETFVPTRMRVYNGQIYVRAGNALYQYGGASNVAYDNCGVIAVTPYADSGTPGTVKQFTSIDVGFEGTWTVGASTDYTTQIYKSVYANTVSSFLRAAQGWDSSGPHYSLQMVESGSAYALFANAVAHVKQANEK